jgi:CRP-like cAMP-binding protein
MSTAQLTGNSFLDSLPAEIVDDLRTSFTHVALETGLVVYERNSSMQAVYFPINSVLSNVLEMSDGAFAEVGLIGHEGMSGLVIALGQDCSNQRTIVQVPDSAKCVPVAAFRAALETYPELLAASLRFGHATLMTSAQLAACNGLHSINERCARWLLMAHDRVDGETFSLTQEFLSQMLGVRRGGVTVAASTMQRAGFISYSRGRITMRDRAGMESAACECYVTVDRNWTALMGYSVNKHARAILQSAQ